ncbi:hypothetical protein [Gorillibacterium sp. CAU 1737]|uniref:hypothetical protein n=1 Tax=Gorillibacterium sp. CAU 1737 TaxID=3140362 RepID=UPI003260219F
MGTSKRKSSEKIKKLLLEGDRQDIQKVIPQVTSEVLTNKRITKELEKDQLRVLIKTAVGSIGGLRAGGFGGFIYEEVLGDPLTLTQCIEKILELAEGEFEGEFSELLLQAFRMALAWTINEEKEINQFLIEFCSNLIFLIVQEEAIEAISDIYIEVSHEQINGLIKRQAKRIVNEELAATINEYMQQRLSLKELVSTIVERAEKVEFGEF